MTRSARATRQRCRRILQVLGKEPHLHLVGAQDVADIEVVGTVVPPFGGAERCVPGADQDVLVRLQQARHLHRYLFPAARRAFDLAHLGDVVRHGDRDTTQRLHAFRQLVDQIHLLRVVLIEQ